MELSPDLTPSFQLYISLQICSKDSSVELLSLITYLPSFTLHWLPVEQKIEYKLLLLAFKSVNNDGPSRPSSLLFLTLTLYKYSFTLHSASTLWNNLSKAIRNSESALSFKFALKTYLFQHYS